MAIPVFIDLRIQNGTVQLSTDKPLPSEYWLSIEEEVAKIDKLLVKHIQDLASKYFHEVYDQRIIQMGFLKVQAGDEIKKWLQENPAHFLSINHNYHVQVRDTLEGLGIQVLLSDEEVTSFQNLYKTEVIPKFEIEDIKPDEQLRTQSKESYNILYVGVGIIVIIGAIILISRR